MMLLKMANLTAVIAVLSAFCFATVFSSDATAALRGRRSLDVNNKIDVFRCDANNHRISSTIANKTEELEDEGFDVRICFEATRLATSDNLYILKIDDFSYTKDRTNGDLAAAGPTRDIPPIMRQQPVDHGIPLSDDVTKLFCEPGAKVCALETRLTGYFFLTSGTIMGKGSILMQRGSKGRRDLQAIDTFQDVYIEIDYTGGGKTPMLPEKRRIIIIASVIAGLMLILCCCGLTVCCMLGLCCFAGRDKRETEQQEDIEEVSVRMEYAPGMKKKDEEDMSETESLEDDSYWDDDISLTDDEDEREVDGMNKNVSSRAEVNPIPAPPFQDPEDEAPKKKSRRKSRRSSSKSIKTEETYEDDYNEIIAISDPEETPRTKTTREGSQ